MDVQSINWRHVRLSPCQRAERWHITECRIANGECCAPNEFDPYVPLEVREFTKKMRAIGVTPRFTQRHFELWAALIEILGAEIFAEPFQWNEDDVAYHLLGFKP